MIHSIGQKLAEEKHRTIANTVWAHGAMEVPSLWQDVAFQGV